MLTKLPYLIIVKILAHLNYRELVQLRFVSTVIYQFLTQTGTWYALLTTRVPSTWPQLTTLTTAQLERRYHLLTYQPQPRTLTVFIKQPRITSYQLTTPELIDVIETPEELLMLYRHQLVIINLGDLIRPNSWDSPLRLRFKFRARSFTWSQRHCPHVVRIRAEDTADEPGGVHLVIFSNRCLPIIRPLRNNIIKIHNWSSVENQLVVHLIYLTTDHDLWYRADTTNHERPYLISANVMSFEVDYQHHDYLVADGNNLQAPVQIYDPERRYGNVHIGVLLTDQTLHIINIGQVIDGCQRAEVVDLGPGYPQVTSYLLKWSHLICRHSNGRVTTAVCSQVAGIRLELIPLTCVRDVIMINEYTSFDAIVYLTTIDGHCYLVNAGCNMIVDYRLTANLPRWPIRIIDHLDLRIVVS